MIVDKTLVISNKKKVDIMTELRKLQFRPFPTIKKAKDAGETEQAVEDEDEDEDDSNGTDYDYLLNMRISSLTKERVSEW